MTVLATAGHVDHGKSTLVNFLTGQETDRLKEEKQRGLTISLGYTYFDYEESRFSIVDVPGHSDYFKNTISGFSNVDGVLFCVDSTQGWSQQSEEHFLSLINLGINNLLFFLTKTDKNDIVFGKNEMINKLPKTFQSPTMAPYCKDEEKYQVVEDLIKEVEKLKDEKFKIDNQEIKEVLTVNGVRFSFEDNSWGLIRASSNKPSLVIVTESPTSDDRKIKIFNFIDRLLQKTGKIGEYDQKI